MPISPKAFLSYNRIVNDIDNDSISRIRRFIEGEVTLFGIRDFRIFQDLVDLPIGSPVTAGLKAAVDGAYVLLPVITPHYLQSPICRSEWAWFRERERKLGRADLIVPLYYFSVMEIDDRTLPTKDEIILELRERNWCDIRSWRHRRLRNNKEVGEQARRIARKIFESLSIERSSTEGQATLPIESATSGDSAIRAEKAPTNNDAGLTSVDDEFFRFDGRTLPFVVVDGDGTAPYSANDVTCRITDLPLQLPRAVVELRGDIERQEIESAQLGHQARNNGPLFSVSYVALDRVGKEERRALRLVLRESDYFTYLATCLSLDKQLGDGIEPGTLRSRYLATLEDPTEPIEFLANGLGIVLVVETSDSKLVVTRRGNKTSSRRGEFDVSVIEGINPARDTTKGVPDLYSTAKHGLNEELGIKGDVGSIEFLGIGVDWQYYQWNIIGVAHVGSTSNDIRGYRTRGHKDKLEFRSVSFVDNSLASVLTYSRQEPMWSTGVVALYWYMVSRYGYEAVLKATGRNH